MSQTHSALFSSSEQDAIRDQLNRILASRQFRKSRRFPEFLRYTVEHTLHERAEEIKERTLGVEVFGRNPDYDTSIDPVVRMTAAEVRKRIAQYYHEAPGSQFEIRIDFPRGSYVPEFSFPVESAISHHEQVRLARSLPTPRARLGYAGVILLCCLLASAFVWWQKTDRHTSRDVFWAPVEESREPILLCIPDINAVQPPSLAPPPTEPFAATVASLPIWFRRERVVFGDSFALAILTALLGRDHHPFYIRRTDDAELQDLEEGPVVLIGGRSNQWTVELGKSLRFGFVRDGSVRYISDRQNPAFRRWGVTGSMHDPGAHITEDYALISRVADPTTGRTIITVAGILQYGTEAAAQCLVTEACIAQAEHLAPGNWKGKNIQIVIGAPIIGEDVGAPRALSAYVW